ncbi:FAD-dependent monooxygenase [Streptomyces sp. NPDC045251]|uniref:FAD-dependent monooxygenase n=1 Tax=unclassified Streptomyces TaxID=2593676 RepID=UPI0034082761
MTARTCAGTARDDAVVVGAGIAGLLAAKALAGHYRRVTLVDRDRLPERPVVRSGAPQGAHGHMLLGRGLTALESLLPGIRANLVAGGAEPVDLPGDAIWLSSAGLWRRFRPGMPTVSLSRDLVERTLRRRVLDDPRIECRSGTEGIGLATSQDGRTVTGLRIRRRGEGGSEHTLPASLVIDAGGRGSHCCEWLAEAGYPAPEETSVECSVGYASRFFARPSNDRDWRLMLLQAQPPRHTRSGMIFPVDGDRWLVSLVGRHEDHPPNDADGFLEFAAGLRSPVLYEALRSAEPLSGVRGFKVPRSYRRRFDRMERWPDNFAVIGDAACALNPVYAQGMTVAAISALELRAELRRPMEPGRTKRLRDRMVRASADAWLFTSGEDLRYVAGREGTRPPLRSRVTHSYLERVMRAARHDPVVNRAVLQVMNMEKPPNSLLRPHVMLHALRDRTAPAAVDGP